jgi:hypothetical protein
MPENFGARLRQQRESRQIPLTTISAQTKINISLLEGLERDDLSRWPMGIFRRSFIRDYARTIGLQPDVVVREFLEHYPDPLDEPISALNEAANDPLQIGSAPPTRFRHLFGAAVGSFSRLRPASGQREVVAPSDLVPRVDPPPSPAIDTTPTSNEPPAGAVGVLGDPGSEVAAESGATSGTLTSEILPLVEAELSSASETETGVSFESEPAMAVAPEPEHAAPVLAEPDFDVSAAARLCTSLGCAGDCRDLAPLLAEASRLIGAAGLIVWAWSPSDSALTAALAHGYPSAMLARLPHVPCDAPNATAAAFRSGELRTVDGGELASDALVVPLLTAAGCPGVLAIELPHGEARRESTQALATIVAAQIGRLVRPSESAASDRRLA